MKEHKDECRNGSTQKSTVANHTWKEHDPFAWVILDQGRRNELVLKEALNIQQKLELIKNWDIGIK